MSKVAKPLIVIVLAIGIAAALAFFLTRRSAEVPEPSGLSAAPSPDTAGTSIGRIRGPENAPLTLTEYGDYQCPSCKAYHPIVSEVLRRFPTQVRLEFRHYPLVQIHPNAMAASVAAEAAGEQGRYWEMHDLLFDNQSVWSRTLNPESEFLSMANRIGLDANRFMQSVRSPELQQRVLRDVVLGRDRNVEAVPTFFLNGERIASPPTVAEFVRTIELKLPAVTSK
jgi:protein-disulfide isomerase